MTDFGSMVSLGARRSPDAVAITERDGRSISYRDLDDRSTRLAHALHGIGLQVGDRVACWLEDSIEYVETYAAIAKAGLVLVALNTRMAPPEAAFQLEQSRASGLVYSAGMAEKVSLLPDVAGLRVLAVVPEGDVPILGIRYDEALAQASSTPLPPPDPASVFMIGYTSGTTGRPKGAMITHQGIAAVARTQQVAMRIPLRAVNTHAVSMSFPATVTCHIIPTLMAGGRSILTRGSWNTEVIMDLIERERSTFIYLPGPSVAEFTELAEQRPGAWQTLTAVLHAGSRGDPLALERLADVIGSRFLEGWGMTENSGGVLAATGPQDVTDPNRPADFFSSVGSPVPGAEVVAVDDDGMQLPRHPEAIGELKARSSSLFAGYFDNPEATAKSLDAEGWYSTGDIGAVGPDGRVYISDRRSNMIASGGMNVYPAEIEMVLERHEGIAEVAVGGGPHPRWGTTPVAVVVRAPGSTIGEEDVIAYAKANLASYKKPTRVVFVDEMPRTVGGKLARPLLAPLFQGENSSRQEPDAGVVGGSTA
jgi:acyl-CoA synthetase (AMP-forming)/AMP-acid ligase II